MREFGSVLGGIGLLIFVYVAVTNYQGVVAIADGTATSGSTLIKTLQGR